jgi:sulfur carrier protein ThiS
MTIQVMLNDEGFVPRDELARQRLKDGDRVKIMLLVGGG